MVLCSDNDVNRFNATGAEVLRTIQPLILGSFELRLIGFHRTFLPSGMDVPEHEHPNYEFAIAEKGEVTTFLDDRKVRCAENNNTILFIPPSTLHSRSFGTSSGNVVMSMVILISGRDEEGRYVCTRLPEMIREHDYQFEMSKKMRSIFQEIQYQASQEPVLSVECTRYLLSSFLTLFFQENFGGIFGQNLRSHFAELYPFEGDRVAAIKFMIINHMNRQFPPLRELEAAFHLSSHHMNRLFKKETGMSILRYWNMERLKNAETLLSDSQTAISEIGKALGFKSHSLFSIFFRKYKGISPSEYRKNILEKHNR